MTNDHPPPDTPKILEVLEPFVDFCECQMRFGANDFAHRHDPPRGHGLHDNLVRRDYKISVFKKRIGIKRQWCGHRGKVDNCQVGVFMGYVSQHDHVLLDFRLSLPEEWARDEQRRQACHVPSEVGYQTRQEQCLEMLEAWGEQVPHGWVTGDDELGRHTRFRQDLRKRGERYVLGVPCTTTLRDLEAPLPAYAGRGRHPK